MLFSFTFLGLTCSLFCQNNSPLEVEKQIYANEMLKAAIQEKDSAQLAEAYYLLGKIEASKLHILQSNTLYYKSLKILEKRNDYLKIGRVYLRLFEMELAQNHPDDAYKYIQKATFYFKKLNSLHEMKSCYTALGQLFVGNSNLNNGLIKHNLDSALYYFRKTETISIVEKDELELARIRLQIGAIYIQLNDKRAIDYLEKSMKVHEKYQQQAPLLQCMLDLSHAYVVDNQLDKGLSMIRQVEKKKVQGYSFTKDNIITLEGCYTHYFQVKGDWKEAFAHYYKLKEFQEQAFLSDREGAVSELNIAYDTEKKQTQILEQKREIALQEEVVALQKRFLWLVGSLLILTIIVGYIFFRLYKKNQELSRRNSILLQEQNHRVKNNLQVISSLLRLQANQLEDGKAKQAVDESQLRIEAITILHRQLYDRHEGLEKINMENFIVELSEVILQTYDLQNVEIEYDITLEEMITDKAIFIGLIINELISNACKYAFNRNEHPLLKISFTENLNWIILKVKDNGNQEIENLEKLKGTSSSFGMKLINMMVLQLDGNITYKYDEGAEFTVKFKEF